MIVNYGLPLPIAYSPLPIPHYPLPIPHCPFPITHLCNTTFDNNVLIFFAILGDSPKSAKIECS
ncbi:hypothetical protein AA637_02815 [Cyanobacterium sp. HL-69]|nr:hypothetical protein AA637_02815 [Cyanobacterium sp. HL-69]